MRAAELKLQKPLSVTQKFLDTRVGIWVDSDGINHHVVKVHPDGYLMCKATQDGTFKAGEMYVLTARQVENLGMEFVFPFEALEEGSKGRGHDHRASHDATLDGSTIMAAEHIISSALSMFGGALLAYGWTHGSGALLGLAGALPFASSAWVLVRAYRNRKTR